MEKLKLVVDESFVIGVLLREIKRLNEKVEGMEIALDELEMDNNNLIEELKQVGYCKDEIDTDMEIYDYISAQMNKD